MASDEASIKLEGDNLPLRPRRTSSLWVRDNPRWNRLETSSVKQQVRMMRESNAPKHTINVLRRTRPLDEEIAVIERLLRATTPPADHALDQDPDTDFDVLVHASAVSWARATTWHRIICRLEDDLQRLPLSASQLSRMALYDKLDPLRCAFYEQLSAAERQLLLLKCIDAGSACDHRDRGGPAGARTPDGAQRKVFDHSLGVVKLCRTAQEIDELGDNEITVESEYVTLSRRYEEAAKEVQALEADVRTRL